MLDINDIKKVGTILQMDDQPYIVVDAQHEQTGRRRANVKTKLKNLITGATINWTFNAGDKAKEANIDKAKATFLYADDQNVHFMNTDSYEQFSLSQDLLSDKQKYLKEGQEIVLLSFDQKPINIELPKKVDLRVTEAPPSIRGNSISNIMKQITLETGLKISAPIFIKEGDVLRINTDSGEYVERV
jgi:elongation factor P